MDQSNHKIAFLVTVFGGLRDEVTFSPDAMAGLTEILSEVNDALCAEKISLAASGEEGR